jgi:hypothetical protein
MNKTGGFTMNKMIAVYTIFLSLILGSAVMAGQGVSHEGHVPTPGKMAHDAMPGTFEHQAVVDGVRAEFQIMSLASMNMKDPNGATHHIMVKFFHDAMDHQIKKAVGKAKVVGPDKTEQTGLLEDYGGIFAANFSFEKAGKYGVICLTKIDGKKHLYKFWYAHQ